MVTGRGCFPVGERGHRWPQKVDLRSPRPAPICVPHGSGIAFHDAGTGERAPRGRAHVCDADEPESQALQSGHSFSLVRVVMGWPISCIRSSTRPRATMW
jgi:hypothetical protein